MAKNTNINWRKKMIYQVFPRQHSKTRDFMGVISYMSRIKKLGADIIYLLPIKSSIELIPGLSVISVGPFSEKAKIVSLSSK